MLAGPRCTADDNNHSRRERDPRRGATRSIVRVFDRSVMMRHMNPANDGHDGSIDRPRRANSNGKPRYFVPGLLVVAASVAIAAWAAIPRMGLARPAIVASKPAAPTAPARLTPETFEALSGLHFGFRATDVPEAELAALPATFPDGQPGDMAMSEAGGGYRDELGIVTKSEARWAITFDARAEANMIANAKSSKWFPVHFQDPVHGGPVRFDLNPYKSLASSKRSDTSVVADPVGNKAIFVDVAHEPHMLYFYALLMRARGNDVEFRWALQEMKYWCAFNYLKMTDNGRGFAKGILNPIASQPRAAAWGLAALFQLYRVLPKDDPWYPSIKYSVEQNILFLDGNFRVGNYDNAPFAPYYNAETGSLRNELGLMQRHDDAYGAGADGKQLMIGAFQAGYLAQVVLFGARLDLDLSDEARSAYRQLASFVARWPVLLFGPANTPGAYDWRRAGEYAISVGTLQAAGRATYFDDGGQVLAANYGRLPALPDDHAFRDHDTNHASDGIATGFVEDILPALAMAVDLKADGAEAAYARASSATQWSGGASYQFSMLPKGRYFREARKAAH